MSQNAVLDDRGMDLLFREARSFNGWKKDEVSDVMLEAIFELTKWGPTSANCSPLRIKFVKSEAQKETLKPFVDQGNVEKTMSAPVVAILAQDMDFCQHLPQLFPHADAQSWFAGNDALIESTARRNATLQAGYFIIAARALGLDCGPISGFDAAGVKDAFFADQNVEIDFLCNLGYGDPDSVFPRLPRFSFADVCEIV